MRGAWHPQRPTDRGRPVYLGAGAVPDPAGMVIPESREKKDSMSDMLSGNGNKARGTSGADAGGAFSDGSVRLPAGVFSAAVAGAPAVGLGVFSPSLGGGA